MAQKVVAGLAARKAHAPKVEIDRELPASYAETKMKFISKTVYHIHISWK